MPLTIGFDADDTLWHNESVFSMTHEKFRAILGPLLPAGSDADARLLATERANLRLFGYGVKSFTLSMIETAIEVTDGRIGAADIHRLIQCGKEMLEHPVELLDGAAEVVETLAARHDLLLITKGDLFDQESKIARSGLAEHFKGIEIVSEKDPATYRRVLARHGVDPADFVMIGNAVRSDIIPVVEIGGYAIHVPYHVTWAHEVADLPAKGCTAAASIAEVPALLERWRAAQPL